MYVVTLFVAQTKIILSGGLQNFFPSLSLRFKSSPVNRGTDFEVTFDPVTFQAVFGQRPSGLFVKDVTDKIQGYHED